MVVSVFVRWFGAFTCDREGGESSKIGSEAEQEGNYVAVACATI